MNPSKKKSQNKFLSFLSLTFFLVSSTVALADDAPGINQNFRKEMGSPEFDANKITRFQVNEINGNLYLYHHLMTIPNPKGLPLNIYLIYNSRNFDAPTLFGKARWSFSLNKYLKGDEFYLITDPGDWDQIESSLEDGDVLGEEPDNDFSDILNQIRDDIEEVEKYLKELKDNKKDTERDIGDLSDLIDELESDTLPNLNWEQEQMQVELTRINGAISDVEYEKGILEGLEDTWQELWDEPNWERDGSPYWMPEDDWEVYQSLGGNEGFIYADELAAIIETLDFLTEQRDELDAAIGEIDEQIANLEAAIENYRKNLSTLESQLDDIKDAISQLEDILDKLREREQFYDDFDEPDYEVVTGVTFVDGEGEAFFIGSNYYHPDSNPMHVDVDVETGDRTLTFKNGRMYTFAPETEDGRILSMKDRYDNETTFTYFNSGDKFYLSMVEDSAGRRVELTYSGDIVTNVTIRYGDETRDFIFAYDDKDKLTSVTNPQGETTIYQYHPPELFPRPHWSDPVRINRCLVSKVIDARNNSVCFEYDGYRCKRLWKEDAEENMSRETKYEYLLPSGAEKPRRLITDSRNCAHVKFIEKIDTDAIGGIMRELINRVDDPCSKSTLYEYDEYYFHLTKTIDTNDLIHEMEYDSMGNVVRKVEDPGGCHYVTKYTYEPAFNQLSSITDANVHTRYFYYVADGEPSGYGPDGILWKEVDAEGFETYHWYNNYGQRIKTEDARGNITEYEYDNPWNYLSKIKKYTNYPSDYYEKTVTYDCFGNKLSETDFNGNLTEYEYDDMNRLTAKKVHEEGEIYTTTYYYDAVGNRTEMINPRGFITKYEYDGFDRLIKVTEAFGTAEAKVTQYDYDTEDNKILEIDPNGNQTTFEYDALNRLIKKTEPLGKVTWYHYNGQGDSSTSGGSHRYNRSKDRYTKMAQNNRNYRGEERWLTIEYDYDDLYRLVKVTDPKNCETEYGYDHVGNKVWEEDANDHRTQYEYDANNRLKKIIDPYSNFIKYWYDEVGNKYQERNKSNHYTYYEYDELNRLKKVTDAEAGELHYSYDGMNKIAERDKNGNWTNFSYNARNLLTETHYALPGIVAYIDYDEMGNKTNETDPNGNIIHYTYEGLNRLRLKTQAYGFLNLDTEYTYDPNGNRTSITDAEENTTEYRYDELNRLVKVIDPINGESHPTIYDYDLMGNKVRTTDANRNKTEYYYDELNRLVKVVDALRNDTTYEYDCVGNRTVRVDAEGQRIEYEYDDLNRLTRRTFIGASDWVEYSYDATGNRIAMVDSTGTTSYEYDDINRLISITTPGPSGSKMVSYTYWPNGERETMTDPDAGVTQYFYDAMNRLQRIIDPDSGQTEYVYDSGSRLIQMSYPNGTEAYYDEYDQANRLIHLKTTNSTVTVTFTEFTYVYDEVGNRTKMFDMEGETTYYYDALYRLTDVYYPNSDIVNYTYDRVGNRLIENKNGVTKDYVYNEFNQLLSWSSGGMGTPTKEITVTGTASDEDLVSVYVNGVEATLNAQTFTADVRFTVGTNVITAIATDGAGNRSQSQIEVSYQPNLASLVEYEYDNNGCLTKKTVDGSDVTTYEYDYENRLIKVILPDSLTNEFTYDGDKRRISKKTSDGTVTRFLYDGLNILQDLDDDGNIKKSYLQGIGIDKLISVTEWGEQTTSYYHSDAIGSVRSLTDESENQVGTYAYDAWGKVTSETGSSGNEYKFTSRRWEDEIGLQYNRARFYDPEIGRFTTPDPLTGGPDDPTICYMDNIYAMFHRVIQEHVDSLEPHKHNRYVYCYNNPINNIDPLGLQAEGAISAGFLLKVFIVVAAYAAYEVGREDIGDALMEVDRAITEVIRDILSAGGASQYDITQSDWTKHAEGRTAEQTAWSGTEAGELSDIVQFTEGEEIPEVSPGEEGAQAEVGEEGAQAEVDEDEPTVESAGTRNAIDIDEDGTVRIREEPIYTGTEDPWEPPVDKPPPPPNKPVQKAIVDLIEHGLSNVVE